MEKILKFLKSNEAVFIAAVMSLATQLWHSVRAFVALDVGGEQNLWNYLFGVLFSVSTSFAILLFTVRGRKQLAYFFLAVEVFINAIHYNLIGMDIGSILYYTAFMCLIVPVTISLYSSEIDPEYKENEYPVNEDSPELSQDIEFINEVNALVGFDITNPKDKSGEITPKSRAELRKLWMARKSMSTWEVKEKMKGILKNGDPLFGKV